MKIIVRQLLCIILLAQNLIICADNPKKIVGLVAVRNEEGFIANCLKALAHYTDSIVVLNDASQDATLAVVESLRDVCHVEHIITKTKWVRDERGDKDLLLRAGRSVGGTHFIMVDADEIFNAGCMKDNWLRTEILKLQPGQIMTFPMANLWGSISYYRSDDQYHPLSKAWHAIPAAFCDDGICNYSANRVYGPSGTMHVPRMPQNIKYQGGNPQAIGTEDLNHCLIHFKSVNLEELEVKKIWYMFLEYIHSHNAEKVNKFYMREFYAVSPTKIQLKALPLSWLDYKDIDLEIYKTLSTRRKQDILGWIDRHGIDYFKDLKVWHIKWLAHQRKKRSHR